MHSKLAISDDNPQRQAQSVSTILSPGDILANRFVIVGFLARGGMGEVYEAQDRLLNGALIALKTVTSSLAGDVAAQERFKKEVLLARQVNHPNVCPIYDLFYCGDPPRCQCFLTMKLLRGESLAARLQRVGRLQHEEAWPIVRQIASALRAAHEAGVVHRDFKPSNIMLDGGGLNVHATVTDFGLARDARSGSTLAVQAQVCGTPGYIAPELFQGQLANAASDLYAFGVVLREIYLGRPDLRVTQSVSSPPVEVPFQDVPRFCARLIRDCLDADPLKRCRAFDQAFPVFDRKSPSGSSYPTTPHMLSRRKLLGAAAAVSGLAAGAWWQSDEIQSLLQPLPSKRFVALLSWPPPADARVAPLLNGALDAIAAELSRAEMTDRNLLIISPRDVKTSGGDGSQLKQCCDSVGANLALAASGVATLAHFKVSLKLLDAATGSLLRERHIVVATQEIAALTSKAVAAAAHLLDLNAHQTKRNSSSDTNSPDGYRYFQTARNDLAQLNDAGLDPAIESYGKALLADPRYVDAYAELALAYCRKFAITNDASFLDLARANASAALRLDNKAVSAYVANAQVLADVGEPSKAIQEISKALALDPENVRTLNAEAEVYQRLNRLADAEATYRRLLSIRPNHWLTYNRLGALLNSQGRYQEALKNFRVAVILAPRSFVALGNVGAMSLKLGLLKEAESSFQRSLSAKADDSTYCNLSQAALVQARYSDALGFALKAVELNPSDDLKWLQLGDCYQRMAGKLPQAHAAYLNAVNAVNRRLQTDGTDGSAWMLLALYSIKNNPAFDPLPLVRKAEVLGASDLDSQLTKIRILELVKRRAEALAVVAECFKRGTTPFEVTLVPDLDALRRDPQYSRLENAVSSGKKI